MSTAALKASRGSKRRCQNEACNRPFYDLNRTKIVCPDCSTVFVPPVVEPRAPTRGRPGGGFGRSAAALPVAPDIAAVDAVVAEHDEAETPAGADPILEVEEEEAEGLEIGVTEEPRADE